MTTVSHIQQKERWEKEHATPYALKQMDGRNGSSCLAPFVEFLKEHTEGNLTGIEMGCGKGRNVIWLAEQERVAEMYGFDFSQVAIAEAKSRAQEAGVEARTHFDVMDATEAWAYSSNFFDFGIDCTATTDIEDREGRQRAINEMYRVLKPGGYYLVYVMSTDDEYHAMMIAESPAEERYAFIHPETGKFEKVFSEEELDALHAQFTLVASRRIEKTAEFFGKSYACKHHWRVYQK